MGALAINGGTPGKTPRLRHPAEEVDYTKVRCPVAEDFSRGIAFEQNLLLGDDADTRDIVDAFDKVYAHLEELAGAMSATG